MKIRTDTVLIPDAIKTSRTVAKFWDQLSEGWRTIWGPHIHHGYYEDSDNLSPLAAQEKLIKKLTDLLVIKAADQILDVGCGMGGSSLYLAKHYQVQVTGVTLSPKQVELASEQALKDKITGVQFKVDNAMSLASCADHSFDLVWSLESCEQFYDKNQFIQQAMRVLKPGGSLMLATWCSNQEEYENQQAKRYQKLCLAYDLPYMPTMDYYARRLKENGFVVKDVLDWTPYVEKSWDIGVSLTHAYSLFQLFKMVGWRGLRFAFQLKLMQRAFKEGFVKYGVFVAVKRN